MADTPRGPSSVVAAIYRIDDHAVLAVRRRTANKVTRYRREGHPYPVTPRIILVHWYQWGNGYSISEALLNVG